MISSILPKQINVLDSLLKLTSIMAKFYSLKFHSSACYGIYFIFVNINVLSLSISYI